MFFGFSSSLFLLCLLNILVCCVVNIIHSSAMWLCVCSEDAFNWNVFVWIFSRILFSPLFRIRADCWTIVLLVHTCSFHSPNSMCVLTLVSLLNDAVCASILLLFAILLVVRPSIFAWMLVHTRGKDGKKNFLQWLFYAS